MKNKVFISGFLCMLLMFPSCGRGNSANGQVIPGTDGITVERCDWIFSNIPDHWASYSPDAFSKEFAAMLKDYDDLGKRELNDGYIGSLLGGLPDDEFMAYWHSGNGEGFSDNAKRTYTFVDGSENRAKIRIQLDEVFGGDPEYDLHDSFYMMLVKEKGTWVLDDWLYSDGTGKKAELREYLESEHNKTYVHYRGNVLDGDSKKPFDAVLVIEKKGKDGGARSVFGAFRFDDKEDEFYDGLEGTLAGDGTISFMLMLYDGTGFSFEGTSLPDLSKITGEVQVYNPGGRMVAMPDFEMVKQ